MNRYLARMTLNGNTKRERDVNRLKNNIKKLAPDTLSYKEVLIDGKSSFLNIDTGTQTYYKKITSLPDDEVYAGSIVFWNNTYWLITSMDSDNEIYSDGHMQECNYFLKWQNEDGELVERHIITQNASSYSNGLEGGNTFEVGSDQLLLFLPYDEETIKLRRDKRFFIDNNKTEPMVYKITRPDTTSNFKNGHGYISFIVSEDIRNPITDRIDLFLCDYIDPKNNVVDNEDEDVNKSYSKINSTSTIIKSGGNKKIYKPLFYNTNDVLVDNIQPEWNVVCYFKDMLDIEIVNGDLVIGVRNDALIGEQFTITLCDTNKAFIDDSLIVSIKSLY